MCSLISPGIICLGVIIIFFLIYIYLFNTFYSMLRVHRTEDEAISNLITPRSLCDAPFVQIGENCYFFSAMNSPNDYYKIEYKNHYYSIPTKIDWLHTGYSCQTLDSNAHPISIETAKEMKDIAFFMTTQNYPTLHKFWSSGHRSSMDNLAMETFFWYNSESPMNFTNWLIGQPRPFQFPEGLCINLQLAFGDLFMATTNCFAELAFACELDY